MMVSVIPPTLKAFKMLWAVSPSSAFDLVVRFYGPKDMGRVLRKIAHKGKVENLVRALGEDRGPDSWRRATWALAALEGGMPEPLKVLRAMGFLDGVQGSDLNRYGHAVEAWHAALKIQSAEEDS